MGYNSINSVILSGFIGSDPEIRVLESGTKLAKFSLATSEDYLDQNNKIQTHTQWHSIVCWREIASYAEYHLRRGSLIRVEGKLRSISPSTLHYDNNASGYEIIASTLQLLTNDALKAPQKNSTTPCKNNVKAENQEIEPVPQDVDGIPF